MKYLLPCAFVAATLVACQTTATYPLTQGQTLTIQQYFTSKTRNPEDIQFRVITGTTNNNFCAEVNEENVAGGKTGFRAYHGKFSTDGKVMGVTSGGENSTCTAPGVTVI